MLSSERKKATEFTYNPQWTFKRLFFLCCQHLLTCIFTPFYLFKLFSLFVLHSTIPSRVILRNKGYRDLFVENEVGEQKYITIEGDIQYHYVARGDKKKPLMLFVHGFPECWYSWRHQMEVFSSDYYCVALDMKGYGLSDKPFDLYEYSVYALVEDLEKIITGLGYEECVLVGHDWGGALTWLVASVHPRRVSSLIILNAPHLLAFYQYAMKHPTQILRSSYIFFFQVPLFPELLLRSKDYLFPKKMYESFLIPKGEKFSTSKKREQIERGKEDVQRMVAAFAIPGAVEGGLNYYRALKYFDRDSWNYAKISCPVLVIWGMKDKFLDVDMTSMFPQYADNVKVVKIPDAGHFIQQEAPEMVNNEMNQFLKKL